MQSSVAMEPRKDNRWSGKFQLQRSEVRSQKSAVSGQQSDERLLTSDLRSLSQGLYRVEVRNELGHANKPMKEAKYVAIVDAPPQITVERPAQDLTLGAPAKVPLVLAAHDDFGLANVSLVLLRHHSPLTTRHSPLTRSSNNTNGRSAATPSLLPST